MPSNAHRRGWQTTPASCPGSLTPTASSIVQVCPFGRDRCLGYLHIIGSPSRLSRVADKPGLPFRPGFGPPPRPVVQTSGPRPAGDLDPEKPIPPPKQTARPRFPSSPRRAVRKGQAQPLLVAQRLDHVHLRRLTGRDQRLLAPLRPAFFAYVHRPHQPGHLETFKRRLHLCRSQIPILWAAHHRFEGSAQLVAMSGL